MLEDARDQHRQRPLYHEGMPSSRTTEEAKYSTRFGAKYDLRTPKKATREKLDGVGTGIDR